jgi:hypothetical protein
MPDKKAQALAQMTAFAYRDFMNDLAEKSPLEILRTRMDLQAQVEGFGDSDLEAKILGKLVKAEKSGKASSEQPGIEIDSNGVPRFVDKPPFVYHVGADGQPVSAVLNEKALARYKETLQPDRRALLDRYAMRDVAFKVVGVGSVGTFCAIALMATADNDQIILQLKQADVSAVAGLAQVPLTESQQGRRAVDGQRAMQAAPDIFLGWTQDDSGRQFYMRQLKNRRLGSIAELVESKALPAYATLCGRTLARAHARSGDPAMIAGYIGGGTTLDEALASFAMAYASQTVLDHAKLVASSLVPKAEPIKKAA